MYPKKLATASNSQQQQKKKKKEKLQVLEYRISFKINILYAGKHKVGLSFLFPNDWGNW